MTLTSGFFNSISSDRKYDAVQMSTIFDGIIKDGVFSSIGGALLVSPGTGLKVSVAVGRAWFDHTWTFNDAPLILDIDFPDLIANRIDTVVLETNSSIGVRANTIKVLKGTPSASPTPPTLTKNAEVNQYPLANVLVSVGISEIQISMITNRVGTTDCPFVTGPLTSVSTSDLLAQWEAQFTEWFDLMKDQLSEDAAGNLQIQINDIEEVNTEQSADISVLEDRGSFKERQTSSATSWEFSPIINEVRNFAISKAHVQAGQAIVSREIVGATFPKPFKYDPLVIGMVRSRVSPTAGYTFSFTQTANSPTGFAGYVTMHTQSAPYNSWPNYSNLLFLNWIAIGEIDE